MRKCLVEILCVDFVEVFEETERERRRSGKRRRVDRKGGEESKNDSENVKNFEHPNCLITVIIISDFLIPIQTQTHKNITLNFLRLLRLC